MNLLTAANPLARTLRQWLGLARLSAGEVYVEPLPASRQVLRFTFPEADYAVVGKFFSAYPPQVSSDLSLAREYDHYRELPALGLANGRRLVPRLLGRWPEHSLAPLYRGLGKLAHLLAFFHSRPVPVSPVSPDPALAYMDKLMAQLQEAGLLTAEDRQALAQERADWGARCRDFPDRQVLVHGDATPSNFLFPDGRAVALDLERLRIDDRLWDLSWVAGELKHAWGWRTGNWGGSEEAIRHFFRAYLAALPSDGPLIHRLYRLNPFYMALAELRIARNLYLTRDYRRGLVAEARRCLAHGRRL
jgi:Ser/Thr protein kinase RdoA (MazF antagonist)